MSAMTSNTPSEKPDQTIDEMLAAAEQMLKTPDPIGELYGEIVYLNHWNRTLTIGDQECSVDHPYLFGSKIHAAALKALGEIR